MLDSKINVIKYGGSLLEDPEHRRDFLKDVAALFKKEKVVLVHGGGKEITRALDQKGIQARFINGLRVTDEATMEVVEDVLANVNRQIVRELEGWGIRAEGHSGQSDRLLRAQPLPELGRVGKPESVDIPVFGRLLARPPLPVFYSVAADSVGRPLNINADDFALALALSCQAARLVFLTDSGGVLDKEGKLISRMDRSMCENLIQAGVITGGMRVKAHAALDALEKGVGSVDITKNIKYLLSSGDSDSAVTRFTKQA